MTIYNSRPSILYMSPNERYNTGTTQRTYIQNNFYGSSSGMRNSCCNSNFGYSGLFGYNGTSYGCYSRYDSCCPGNMYDMGACGNYGWMPHWARSAMDSLMTFDILSTLFGKKTV